MIWHKKMFLIKTNNLHSCVFHKPMSALGEHIVGYWAFLQPGRNGLSFLCLYVETAPDMLV